MTNEQRVRDLCRMIRGMADTYPDGFARIVEQVEALRHRTAEEMITRAMGQVMDEAWAATVRPDSQPNEAHTPPSSTSPQEVRRRPGRPRKQRAGE